MLQRVGLTVANSGTNKEKTETKASKLSEALDFVRDNAQKF